MSRPHEIIPALRRAPLRAPAYCRLGVAALALTLGACQTLPETDPALEAAQSAVERAAANPEAARSAELELQRAQQALARAQALWRQRDPEAARHWAYLAQQRAAIVVATAQQASDEQRLRNASTERERVRLEARTRDAELARLQAQAAQQRASAAQQQATAAQMQASSAQQQASAAQRSAVDAREQAQKMRDEAAEAAARNAQLERDLQALKGRKTERGMVVTLGDIFFATGSSTLMPGALREVERLAAVMQQHSERRVLIEGFTDNVGSEESNLRLSQRRAEAFAQALRGYGVAPNRIDVQAYGEAYPVSDNSTAAGRQLNRRVNVVFSDAQGVFAAR